MQSFSENPTQADARGRSVLGSEARAWMKERFGDRVAFDENLGPYLAYRIGGPADALVFPNDASELEWIRLFAHEQKLPVTMIGTGTNLLVLDEGIRGIVVSFARGFNQIEIVDAQSDRTLVRCGAGVTKPELLEWSIQNHLTGLEFSSGVPGTLGGGIFMNAGTKYGCYGDILKQFTVFDLASGLQTFDRDAFSFGYRQQNALRPNRFVVSMVFELRPGDAEVVRREVDRIIAERAEKQPLDYPSCGSTFKNPEGFSAGRLIEKAGLKGTRVGGAEISLKHANFFLNKGGATAADVLSLIEIAKKTVWEQFQVKLETEVIVLGGDGSASSVYNSH